MIQTVDKPNANPIGQDRETLTFKALLYLNAAVHAQVCRLFCVVYMPLTNRVRGPYRKLRTEFYGPSAKRAGHKSKGKKRGSVIYSKDRENEVSKIFIISLVCV